MFYVDSNLLWYKAELFKTQLEVGNQKLQLAGMSLTDSLIQLSLTSHTATLADHGGSITNIQNNHYNKTAVNDLTSNSSNNSYSNSSNISFSYSYNSSNSLFDYSSNNSNDLYGSNSNSSNSLFTYSSNSSNSLFGYSSNNSNDLYKNYSNADNTLNDLINTKQNLLNFNYPLSNFENSISIKTTSSITIDGSGDLAVAPSIQSKWTTNGTHIYNNNNDNVGIGTQTPAHKLEVMNGAINTTDYKFNNNSLFQYAPANSPTFTNGTQTNVSDTDYYIQFTTNGFNYPCSYHL